MIDRNEKSNRDAMKRRSRRSHEVRGGGFMPVFETLEDRTMLTAAHQPPQLFLVNSDGYLTGPSADAPLQIAQNFLRSRAGELGILSADFNDAIVTTNYVTATTGATTITLQQSFNGLPVFNANYNVTVARDGRVLSAGGGFVPGLSQRVGNVVPSLDVKQALISAAGRSD